MLVVLEGKYVKLRALEKEDLSKLRQWRNSKFVRKTTREFRLLNMINQENWFESIHLNNPPKEIMFGVINKKGELIGVTGLTYIDWKNRHAEISIYLNKEKWQETKEAHDIITVITEYGFGELNMHRLWAEIFSLATENIKLFERMKFVREGVLRQKLWRDRKWWDSILYSKLSNEHKNVKKN
jgi:RimJ/RimL family protein N-acetyltransferase